MPVDPQTGERLPYPGEPGYTGGEGQEAPAPAPEDPTGQKAAEMLKTIDDEIAAREAGEAPEGEEAPEGGEEGAESLAPLEETLGITPERAQMLFDAAQELAKTKGKSPQELADMIAGDFEVLMQLEMIAARSQDAPKEDPAAMMEQPQEMMPEGAPGMMPPMGPQGGM